MVDSGVIMININDSFQDGVCVGVVPLLIVEMQKAGFFYLGKTVWVKRPQTSRKQYQEVCQWI